MWRSIRIRLVAIQVLLLLFALELIGGYFVRALNQSLLRAETDTVSRQTQLIATIVTPEVIGQPGASPTPAQSGSNASGSTASSTAPTQSLLQSFPQLINGVVYVLNKDGVVRDTSAGSALIGQKRIDSLATETLISHKKAVAVHYDPVTHNHLLTVVVPIFNQGQFAGIVESAVSVQNTYTTMRQVTAIFYSGSGLVLALAAALGILLSRTIARPVLDVTNQARKLAAGDFSERVTVHSDDEFGALATAINDLTDKLQAAIAESQHEQGRLQAVIKYMGDGVIAFDKDLNYIFSNDAAARMLPSLTQPDFEPSELLDLQRTVEEDKSEYNAIKKFGNALLNVHITKIGRKQAQGYVALIRDVTEQEKLQAARRDFVANVSHELKTPLTSVKSYIEALQQYDDTDEETRKRFLEVIDHETNRMVRLTQDLLQLSGLELRQEPFRAGLISAKEWLETSVERFTLSARQQGVTLVSEMFPAVSIRGDRDMLDRLVDNLLSNALKYTPRDGMVRIKAIAEPDELVLVVEDTGIGIPADDLPHVFERFYTVDKARTRKFGGTGLGLAIAREIAERHGGTISLASEQGHGTTVTVILPIVEVR
jgi:two-component system, OmpR family, sensor histidine kinase VicK